MEQENKKQEKTTPFGVILKIIGVLVIVLTIIVCLMAVVPRMVGYETANVVSGSMEPAIPVGSLVMAKAENNELHEAEYVIMFVHGSGVTDNTGSDYISHRVVSNDVIAREVITKGDANEKEDLAPIPYYQIVGKVQIHIPFVGNLLQQLNTMTGKIYAIVLVVIGLVLIIVGSKLKRKS